MDVSYPLFYTLFFANVSYPIEFCPRKISRMCSGWCSLDLWIPFIESIPAVTRNQVIRKISARSWNALSSVFHPGDSFTLIHTIKCLE